MQAYTKSKIRNGSDIHIGLVRWSIHEPYRCIFVCKHGSNVAIQIEKEEAVNIEGHYYIDRDVNFYDALTLLAESG